MVATRYHSTSRDRDDSDRRLTCYRYYYPGAVVKNHARQDPFPSPFSITCRLPLPGIDSDHIPTPEDLN